MRKNAPLLILLIIVSFLFNGVFPRYTACPQEYDCLISLIQRQPVVQYYGSLATVPVGIVSKLMNGSATGVPEKKPVRRAESGPNTSADYSIKGSDRFDVARGFTTRLQPVCGLPAFDGRRAVAGNCPLPSLPAGTGRDTGGGGGNSCALFMLLLMLLLPRCSVGDGVAALSGYRYVFCPIWKQTKLGFSFGVTA